MLSCFVLSIAYTSCMSVYHWKLTNKLDQISLHHSIKNSNDHRMWNHKILILHHYSQCKQEISKSKVDTQDLVLGFYKEI